MEGTKSESKLMKNKFRFILLIISASLIYGLPYFRLYYYDAYLTIFKLTNTQIGTLGSIYGIFGMISYLLGGVLADRIPVKILVAFSLIGTGLGGLIHLTKPSYTVLVLIYAWWGITSLLTFWPAFVKGIRLLANSNEQGKAFGLMEGGRGVVNALHLAIALAIFGFATKAANDSAGINGVVLFYSVVVICLGILTFLFIKDGENEASEKFELSNIGKVLKMPAVWILTIILCASYTMNMSFYYFTPYATGVFGATALFGAILTMLAQYVRPFASSAAGIIGDKIGCSKILLFGFSAMTIGTALVIFTPGQTNLIPILIIGCIIIYVAMYSNYGVIFSLMEEGGIPLALSGTAIGVISTIGYLPEVFVPYLAGKTLDTYGGVTGYRYYFIGVIIVLIIGFVATMVWSKMITKNITKNRKNAIENLSS